MLSGATYDRYPRVRIRHRPIERFIECLKHRPTLRVEVTRSIQSDRCDTVSRFVKHVIAHDALLDFDRAGLRYSANGMRYSRMKRVDLPLGSSPRPRRYAIAALYFALSLRGSALHLRTKNHIDLPRR